MAEVEDYLTGLGLIDKSYHYMANEPQSAADYDARLAELTIELGELDVWIEDTLAPYRGRAFVVFHPSWGYFADDYGLRQIAIETEGKEPSDSELTGIQEETRSLGVSVVFVQPQIAGKSAQAIAGAMGSDVLLVPRDAVRTENGHPLVLAVRDGRAVGKVA